MSDLVVYLDPNPTELAIVSFLDRVLVDLERIRCESDEEIRSAIEACPFPEGASMCYICIKNDLLFYHRFRWELKNRYKRELKKTVQKCEITINVAGIANAASDRSMLPSLTLGGRFYVSKDDRLKQIVKAGTWTKEAETLGICAIKIFSLPFDVAKLLMAESVFQSETPADRLGAKDKELVIEALGFLRGTKLEVVDPLAFIRLFPE